MEREMQPIKVSTDDNGLILLTQEEFGLEEPSIICIHPDQVDLLIQWIEEAREELEGN